MNLETAKRIEETVTRWTRVAVIGMLGACGVLAVIIGVAERNPWCIVVGAANLGVATWNAVRR